MIHLTNKQYIYIRERENDDGLYEKKWNSGLRSYFSIIIESNENKTLLLLGSTKRREQEKAINKAKGLVQDYKLFSGNIIRK